MKKWGIAILLLVIVGCNNQSKHLPYLGTPVQIDNETNYPVIPPFSFVNQDSLPITEQYFADKIYIADFIFLSCPTICPKMNSEMNIVYNEFKNNPDVLFLSHTVDPENDNCERLKNYTKGLNIDTKKWNFVTGNKDSIFYIAEKGYYSIAYSDSTAPGGLVHSGGLLLIDKSRHIRGVYDGTNAEATNQLIKDIKLLLEE